MPVKKLVFDTTVLSNFLLADALPLLILRYQNRGVISWEVYDELTAGFRKSPAMHNIEQLMEQGTFSLVTLQKKEHSFYSTLLDALGKGEASCIALARFSCNIVASDDKAARRICDSHNISYTGTIGILISACRDGQLSLDNADKMHTKMVDEGFYSPVKRISDVV